VTIVQRRPAEGLHRGDRTPPREDGRRRSAGHNVSLALVRPTVAVSFAFALALSPGAAGAGGARWPVVRSPLAGFELRYPPGWHAARWPEAGIVVSSRPIARWELHGPYSRRAVGAAYVWVTDYGQAHRTLPSLPEPLRLPAPVAMEGFGTVSSLEFGLHGHQLQAIVAFGPGAPAAARTLAARTLGLLRTTRPQLPNRSHAELLGRSVDGRPIRAFRLGDPRSPRRLLVVGCIHGDECAGTRITLALLNDPFGIRAGVWVVQDLNPDGFAAGRRQNAHGVDLNRNFPAGWRRIGSPGSPQWSGPRPFSEPETRIARDLVERIRPDVTIWFHQHADLVRAWGPSIPVARRYARLVGLPFRRLPWLAGTAPNWQNHRFPGTSSFVVELPAGALDNAAARRYARAIVALASSP
jgi:murein peptide amidase A